MPSLCLTRREFVVGSGAAAAVCALGAGWSVPARAAGAPGGMAAIGAPGLRGEGSIQRVCVLAEGGWHSYGWERCGGSERIELSVPGGAALVAFPSLDPVPHDRIRIITPLRGLVEVSHDEFRRGAAHDVVRTDFGIGVLEEALAEVRRRAVASVQRG